MNMVPTSVTAVTSVGLLGAIASNLLQHAATLHACRFWALAAST
jgi:hypothetical protein